MSDEQPLSIFCSIFSTLKKISDQHIHIQKGTQIILSHKFVQY